MDERAMTDRVRRAIEDARRAWTQANQGLPSNPMTKTAEIPAVGAIAASILNRPSLSDEEIVDTARQAIVMARRAWEQSGADAPSNPIARTAERAVIGILAAGILNCALLDPVTTES